MRRINLLRAHGSPTQYLYHQQGCRCAPCVKSKAEDAAAYQCAHREERAKYRLAHREGAAKREAAYRRAHREEKAVTGAAYYLAHREETTMRTATYRLTHREEIAAKKAAYQLAHREEIASYTVAWRLAHREERLAYRLAHLDDDAAKSRNRAARKRAALGTHTAADVAAQYLRQHGRCYWCGVKVGKGYHVDHVIPLVKKGSNGPDNLVIACSACNLAKGAKLPHEFSERMC